MTYKRHQVVNALHALFSGAPNTARTRLDDPVPVPFATRVKRLLEVDLRLARTAPAEDPYEPAFFDDLPQGTGRDVLYSPYRAFTLAVGLELIDVGYKQEEVVAVVSLVQADLKRAFERSGATFATHGRMTVHYAHEDQDPEEYRANAQLYLALSRVERPANGPLLLSELVKSDGLVEHLEKLRRDRLRSVHLVEMSEFAARVRELLEAQPLRKRGPQ